MRRRDRARVGVAVDPHDPRDVGRNLLLELHERAGDAVELAAPPASAIAWPAGNSTSDWKTKRSPTMRMSAVAEDLAQAAEEVGAVARQLLHPLGERDVEPAAEIGDAAWLSLSRDSEALSASSRAASWRRMAAICWFRISTWLSARAGRLLLGLERAVRDRWPRSGRGAAALDQALAGGRGRPRSLKGRLQRIEVVLEVAPAGPLQRQQIGQLGDLAVEASSTVSWPVTSRRQEELRRP